VSWAKKFGSVVQIGVYTLPEGPISEYGGWGYRGVWQAGI
jgi:hypothetical protein